MISPELRPKKSLGQHFLTNPAICARIAALLEAKADDQILEIGPGPGALTQELLKLPHKRLLLLEKDRHWAEARGEDAEALNQDALTFSWGKLPGDWKITGNLPYNIASPLIWDIVSLCPSWTKAAFMVQKEVAERICASPGGKAYGALSVWIQCHAMAKMCFSLKPGAFSPPPKVDSTVITLTPLANRPSNPGALREILKICFQKRRKQLGGILRPWPAMNDALSALGVSPRTRPECLAPTRYMELAKVWPGALKA